MNHQRDDAQRLHALQRIAVELIQTRNKSQVLQLIVTQAMDLLSCDAGSLYLKADERMLSFEVAVNQSHRFDFKQHRVPIFGAGIAAYCFRNAKPIIIDDVYKIREESPYQFDKKFDQMTGYRTRSMLVQPLISSDREVVGVLQLINRKPDFHDDWSVLCKTLDLVPNFSTEDADFLTAFSSLAAAAIENTRLYESIEQLFEGFVHASVKAIENRDPVTRGHSERVAILTTELAENVRLWPDDDIRIAFTASQISELRYAALLHDFGKLGVRESTLLKADKLFPEERERIRARFDTFVYANEILKLRALISQLVAERRAPNDMEVARIKKECATFETRIEDYWKSLLEINRPSILTESKEAQLKEMMGVKLPTLKNNGSPLIEAPEATALSISRGSLSLEQRLEIESHVTKTYEFLKDIPWGKEFADLPLIALTHHEKMDGTGYPNNLKGEKIPPQSRMLAICDIFDALVAPDRPYKPSVPVEKALAILEMETRAGKLDKNFLDVFLEARIYESAKFLELIQKPSDTDSKKKAK